MAGPKVAVIGAGSFFFGRPVIWHMTHSEVLRGGTLALVDTDPAVLKTMMALGERTLAASGAPTKLIGSTNRREVLKDADFVVLTFSERNAYHRGLDCELSLKHGIRMCSGDTIGPGGIFRALREIPKALHMAKDTAELAPDAWIINFVNPTSVLGIALMRYAQVRSFAICDGLHEPHHRLRTLKFVGILPEDAKSVPPAVEARLKLRTGGVNHFTWLTCLEYDGKDYLPVWRERLAEKAREEQAAIEAQLKNDRMQVDNNAHAKAKYNVTYAFQLMDVFGAYPDRIGHTKEYVPYFQGYGAAKTAPEPISIFDAPARAKAMAERWAETEDWAYGRKPIAEFLAKTQIDHATDIIESMWGKLGKAFYVNTANRGAVTNMADDAFLELRCDIDMDGPRPQPFGEMPRGLLGLQQQVLDTHELTAQAAVTYDREILLRAFATDPIVNNRGDARALMEELLEREADALPEAWQASKKLVAV